MYNKILKITFAILIIFWMLTIFTFSNQPATESSNTSGNTIKIIISKYASIKNLTEEEEEELISNLQPIVRKLAHFSLYTLGGILIYSFINTYNIKTKNKIAYSLLVGIIYASTDEFHQLFIEGRSGEIRDICIDSSGILFGILITICLIKLIKKNGMKHKLKATNVKQKA